VLAEAAAAEAEKYEMLFDDQIEYIKVSPGGDGFQRAWTGVALWQCT
jgi:hypothetical protein